MNFSFVIPNYNRYDLVHQVLYDIYQKCSPIHEVIVVNDGCTQPESFTGVEWWKGTGMLPVKALNLEDNVGFLRASNAGMRKATGDIICLISNDVRVNGDIVLRIEHILKSVPRNLVGGRFLNWDTGWNQFNGEIFPYVEGWLLAATKEMWELVDYFDERYAPNDFEDVDLSTMFVANGGGLSALPEDLTHHVGAQSIPYGSKREILTKTNREKFRQKWMS